MNKCIYCGKEFEPKYPEQKFCSRACYYASKRKPKEVKPSIETEPMFTKAEEVVKESSDVLVKKEEIPEEVWAPIEEPKPVNEEFPEGFCPVCGSPIYCGRCVRFTQHKKKKQ